MASLPFFVMIGPSNMNGAGSTLSAYPAADLARVIGLPLFPGTTPAVVTVPGIKMLQCKLPFATSDVRNITDVPASDQVETDGAAFGATNVNQWVFVATNTTGQGQIRRITAQAGNLLTVASAWAPALSADGTLRLITGSRSVGALDVTPGGAGTADLGGTTSTMVDAALVEADDFWVGNTIRFTSGANNGLEREITNFDNATATVSFTPPVTVAVAAADTYVLLQSTKVVKKDTTSPNFAAADEDRWVSVAGQFRRIVEVRGTDTIVLHQPLSIAQAANDPIYVLDGAATADTLANFSQGSEFKDLQFFLDSAPVFFTGFDYSNFRQNAPASPAPTTTAELVNCVPELMTQMRYRFPGTVYGFVIGIDSAQAAPLYIGDTLQTVTFAWRHDLTHLDYHPSNDNGILSAVRKGIAQAKALAAAGGNTLDPQGIFFVGLLENDTLDVQKLAHLGENVALIRDTLRADLGSDHVPCVILGCSPSSVILPNHDEDADRASANAQAAQLKADDPWTGFVETPQDAFIKHPDQIHYLPAGHVAIAQALVDEWEEVRIRANAAAARLAELPTLASLRLRVKRRYERSAVGNDASNTQLDIFINDSLREFYTTIGDDKAWFLRVTERVEVAAGAYPATITLPRTSNRLMRIERQSAPGRPVSWKGLGYTDEGRLRITLHDYSGGPFDAHFIRVPKELVGDTDVAIVPPDYTELIVMLACKRLTENAGNLAMAQYYIAEAERLWRVVKRNCHLYDRMRKEQLTVPFAYDSTTNAPWMAGDEWSL